jgi:hypothetical protein
MATKKRRVSARTVTIARQRKIRSEIEPRPMFENPAYRGSGKLEEMAALITGADSGIGRAVAVLFAREGADVAVGRAGADLDAAQSRRPSGRQDPAVRREDRLSPPRAARGSGARVRLPGLAADRLIHHRIGVAGDWGNDGRDDQPEAVNRANVGENKRDVALFLPDDREVFPIDGENKPVNGQKFVVDALFFPFVGLFFAVDGLFFATP